MEKIHHIHLYVTPAEAGVQVFPLKTQLWIPAFAGMTKKSPRIYDFLGCDCFASLAMTRSFERLTLNRQRSTVNCQLFSRSILSASSSCQTLLIAFPSWQPRTSR